jgi:hypothetical protein
MALTPPTWVWHWQATPPGPSQMHRNQGAEEVQVSVAVEPWGRIVPGAGEEPVIVRRVEPCWTIATSSRGIDSRASITKLRRMRSGLTVPR